MKLFRAILINPHLNFGIFNIFYQKYHEEYLITLRYCYIIRMLGSILLSLGGILIILID